MSGSQRLRTKRFWQKVQRIKDSRHVATCEEKVLRCIAMREGYIHELWAALEQSVPSPEAGAAASGSARTRVARLLPLLPPRLQDWLLSQRQLAEARRDARARRAMIEFEEYLGDLLAFSGSGE